MNNIRIRPNPFQLVLFISIATSLIFITLPPLAISAETSSVREGTTSTYGVLAATTITNTGATSISGSAGGDIGLSPGTSVTGLSSITRSGADHITDTAAATAQTDLVTAYNDLGIPTATSLSAPDLAGRTITPGTYTTASGTFANSGVLTLDAGGNSNAVFIFRAASTVITATSSSMVLTNGAQACNVYWQVGSSATLGVNSSFVGNIYALTSITANTNANIRGQLLARNGAVTLDSNSIVNDRCATAATPTSTTATPTSTTSNPLATTVPASGVTGQLPSTGIDSLIWILGVVFIIGLLLGVIRIRR